MKKILSLALMTIFTFSNVHAGDDDLAYFKQFLFQKENISDDIDFPEYQYRFVMTYWNDKVQLPDGRWLNPNLDVRLYEDGTFVAYYRENYYQNSTDLSFLPGPCKKMTGKWSVPGLQLILEGIGYADRAIVENKNALKITYDTDIISKITGHSVEASLGYSNTDQVFFCW